MDGSGRAMPGTLGDVVIPVMNKLHDTMDQVIGQGLMRWVVKAD